MFNFSKSSREKLSTCRIDLQRLFLEIIKFYDCKILIGYRTEEEQNVAYHTKKSKVLYPHSKHNFIPSLAVDVIPYFENPPHIRWHDIKKFYHFGGYVQAIADTLRIKIRWGGNWDSDDELNDQSFNDLVHFEIKED